MFHGFVVGTEYPCVEVFVVFFQFVAKLLVKVFYSGSFEAFAVGRIEDNDARFGAWYMVEEVGAGDVNGIEEGVSEVILRVSDADGVEIEGFDGVGKGFYLVACLVV